VKAGAEPAQAKTKGHENCMEEIRQYRRKIRFLGLLILLGLIYTALLRSRLPLTGIHQLDGILGILLGIYACAHPAANLLDIALYHHGLPAQLSSKRASIYWWALNIAVLLVGWMVIATGLLRFAEYTIF
jgi:xanthosine utilization system XapX-like protein